MLLYNRSRREGIPLWYAFFTYKKSIFSIDFFQHAGHSKGHEDTTKNSTPREYIKMAEKKNSKAVVKVSPKTSSIENVMTIERQMLEVVESVNKLMPVHLAKTIDDVNYLIDRANAVEGRFSLAKCRLFYRVKSERLYEQGSKTYKTFKDWAEKVHGVKKSTAYDYAKVGQFVNEQGNGSTLPKTTDYDFQYYALVLMVTGLVTFDKQSGEVLDDTKLIDACKNGIITPYIAQNRDDLKKAIKKAQGLGEEVEENTKDEDSAKGEEVTNDKVTTKCEEVESVKAEKELSLSLTLTEWESVLTIVKLSTDDTAKRVATLIAKMIKKAK